VRRDDDFESVGQDAAVRDRVRPGSAARKSRAPVTCPFAWLAVSRGGPHAAIGRRVHFGSADGREPDRLPGNETPDKVVGHAQPQIAMEGQWFHQRAGPVVAVEAAVASADR
jgi:hypothetical protein